MAAPPCWSMLALSGRPLMKLGAVVSYMHLLPMSKEHLGAASQARTWSKIIAAKLGAAAHSSSRLTVSDKIAFTYGPPLIHAAHRVAPVQRLPLPWLCCVPSVSCPECRRPLERKSQLCLVHPLGQCGQSGGCNPLWSWARHN